MAQSDFEQESTANATWSRMLQGNRRFAEGKPDHPWQDKETRQTLLDGQNPDAAVLSCSDSRVPPEIIFDQGLGDLFTVRTAGQLIDSAVIASLEYAVKKLHVSLICVLGHEHCGAIEAAEQELDDILEVATSRGALTPNDRDLLLSLAHAADAANPARSGRGHAGLMAPAASDAVAAECGVSSRTVRRRAARSVHALRVVCGTQ